MTSPLQDVQLEIVNTIDKAMELKRWLGERREGPVGLDTETTGLDAWHDTLRLVQFGDLHRGWAVPCPHWSGVVDEILTAWEGDWVLHNAPFDTKFLARAGWTVPWDRIHDTMTLAGLDDSSRQRGLKFLSGKLVDAAATAGEKLLHDGMAAQKWTWATVPYDFDPYWIYGALDPVLTCHLYHHLRPRVDAVCPAAYDLERGTIRVVTNMMMAGLLVDRAYVETALAELRTFSASSRAWLKSAHGVTSPMSAKQIAGALERFGYEVTEFTPTNLPKIDKETLASIRDWHDSPDVRELAKQILAIRHADKISGTYLQAFLNGLDETGRLHGTISPMGARTHRMTASEPNLQNLPRGDKVVRGSFIPGDGNVLIACDLSQVEARLAAHFTEDAGLIEAFRAADEDDKDFFCGIASGIFGEEVVKSDPRRQTTKNVVYGCVPLEYQILTKRGWLSHDEVTIGDETIGYDPALGYSTWTRITGVHRYDDAELIKIGNAYQSYVTTPNHRWYGTHRDGGWAASTQTDGFFTTSEIDHETRILLGAPVHGDGSVPITDDEAALLGWLFSDGALTVNYEVGGRSQSRGTKRMVNGHIRQSMKKHAALIDELLTRLDAPHRRGVKNGDYVTWALRGPWLRELIQRAGTFYDEWPNPVVFATTLSLSQATAMLTSMKLADGEGFKKGKPWQIDLVATLTYLTGEMPEVKWYEPDGSGWTKKAIGQVSHKKPRLTGQRLKREQMPNGPAWCVTTELGTWTMRVPIERGYRVVLTGNSLYGAGAAKMALTAGVPLSTMAPVKAAFDERYPGIRTRTQHLIETALAAEVPGVRLPDGRWLVCDKNRLATQGLNSEIQGWGAALMKRFLLNIEASGLGPNLRNVVHDEAILEVPAADAEEALRTVEECMTDKVNYRVAITAEGKIMRDRWAK